MHENEIKEEIKTRKMLDSYKSGTAATGGALSVYFDLTNLKETEEKLKAFFKAKKFIDELKARV